MSLSELTEAIEVLWDDLGQTRRDTTYSWRHGKAILGYTEQSWSRVRYM